MAEKKGSGFKTFLLILITVALAVFLGLAGFLILSPNNSVFGLQYRANMKTETIQYITSQAELLKFKKYSTINIDISGGNAHTSVNINCGSPTDHMSASTIVFNQSSSGYQYVGATEKYTLNKSESGTTLNISIIEPEYNFVQVVNNSSLNLNVFSHNDSINSATINITTGKGSVKIGGQIMNNAPADNISIGNLDVKTTSGKIQITDNVQISGTANLKTITGGIAISGDKTLTALNLETETGKINAAKVTGNVSIKSYNSIVKMGDITGKVEVEMTSGILNLQNIDGDLLSDHKILFTTVNAGTITGKTVLINDEGNFSVNIKKTDGVCTIEAGNKNVSIGEVAGQCRIVTKNGSIYVKKAKTNESNLALEAKGRGSVFATFENVLGENKITTNSGRISMKFGSESTYNLDAKSEKNKVYLSWLDVYKHEVLVPDPQTAGCPNTAILKSVSGGIRVDII